MIRFAISVPVGSWHPFLPASLASLRQQGDGVAVALLDASNDPRVAKLANEHDDWLAYRRHGPDGGQSDAILEGWDNLDGDWLGWLNADDLLMPDALHQIRAAHAADPSLEIIYGHSAILDETGAMTGYHFNVEPPGPRILEAGIISQPSCLFSRQAYERAGGLNRDLHYVMDWDLWIRLFKSDAKFGFVDAVLSMVLWCDDTKTASLNARRRGELQALIAEHAPDTLQKSTFRAFAVHAIADRVWPPALKTSVTRRLRRGGPIVFGLRADGAIQPECKLHFAHFMGQPVRGVSLTTDGPTRVVAPSLSVAPEISQPGPGKIDVLFATPLPAGTCLVLDVEAGSHTKPIYLRKAAWII